MIKVSLAKSFVFPFFVFRFNKTDEIARNNADDDDDGIGGGGGGSA